MEFLSKEISMPTLPLEDQDKSHQDVPQEELDPGPEPAALAPIDPTIHSNGISLFKLPLEIRQEVYGYVFGDCDMNSRHSDPSYVDKRGIGIFGTCKALREEAVEFAYANLTLRLNSPFSREKEVIAGPAQSIIDRVRYVTLEINMFDYTSNSWLPRPEYEERIRRRIRNMNSFVPPMLAKLNARKTPGVACAIVFEEFSTDNWSWDEAPFLLEALNCRANFRTVSMELECLPANRRPEKCPNKCLEYNDTKNWCERFLRDDLKTRLEKTMGQGQIREEEHLHCVDFHPQSRLSEMDSPDTTLVKQTPGEDGREEEAPSKDIQEKQGSNGVRLADEDTEKEHFNNDTQQDF